MQRKYPIEEIIAYAVIIVVCAGICSCAPMGGENPATAYNYFDWMQDSSAGTTMPSIAIKKINLPEKIVRYEIPEKN